MSPTSRDARRIVVKVGSSLVTDGGRGVDAQAVGGWCRQMATLMRQQRELVMVSSGAIAEGMKRLGWTVRPHGPAEALHALGDRTARHHHDFAALPGEHRHLPAPVADGVGVDAAAFVGDQARADLDDDPASVLQRCAHGVADAAGASKRGS